MAEGGDRLQGERTISPRFIQPLARFLGAALGREGAQAVFARVVEPGAADDPERWFTTREAIALEREAIAATGDSQVGRRAGEQLFRDAFYAGLDDFIVAAGSIPSAVRGVIHYAMTASNDRTYEVIETGPRHVVIAGETTRGRKLHSRYFCELNLGYYASFPSLFGMVGHASEQTCEARGDERCTYRLAWTRDPRAREQAPDVAASAERRDSHLGRFEEVASVATDLVSAKDVDDVLQRITGRVALAIHAPQYLLAVRLEEDAPLRIHHRGFVDDEDAREWGARIVEHDGSPLPGVMIADVTSPVSGRCFGRVAALFAAETSRRTDAWAQHQRLMDAYAAHAAASLEVVASLEAARRDRDTARALLDLARELADVVTAEDIARRLVPTVCKVVGADIATLWLWNRDTERLHLELAVDVTGDGVDFPREIAAADLPELALLAQSPAPVLVNAEVAKSMSGPLQAMFLQSGLETVAVVPIAGRGGYIGVVSAGFRTRVTQGGDAHLIERLSGLAHHAAVAYENADLVERLRHLALHDPLTGLANRPLLKDRAELALREAARDGVGPALLFIDLDHFKEVNDTLGHAAGDELLVHVARRLERVLRPGDTLGRLGGDEFAAVLPGAGDEAAAARVGARLTEALRFPFVIAGQRIEVACSIGVAVARPSGDSFESLAERADAAMYACKARRAGILMEA